jgi:DNA-binding transcriptional ArsR family regulator
MAGFGSLSQETRLNALRALVKAGHDGMPAGILAEQLDVAPPTLSFHLKDLEHAGLIRARRDGRQIRYRADFDGLRSLLDFLTEDCCQGNPAICGPRRARSSPTC